MLSNLIDYAGLYPPAALPLRDVGGKICGLPRSPDAWMLNRLVLPAAKLAEAPLGEGWRMALLVDREPGPLPPQVETLETKLAHRLSLPTYCEATLDQVAGAFAKLRTGGLTPDAIPAPEAIADFLLRAADAPPALQSHRRPAPSDSFAASALTYAAESPRAVMHGFLNLFAAAAFAWHGAGAACSPF